MEIYPPSPVLKPENRGNWFGYQIIGTFEKFGNTSGTPANSFRYAQFLMGEHSLKLFEMILGSKPFKFRDIRLNTQRILEECSGLVS